MGDIDGPFYDGEGDLRKKIVQMRHKRTGETKMMACLHCERIKETKSDYVKKKKGSGF